MKAHLGVLTLTLVVIGVVGGCAGSPEGASGSSVWVEPQWMAEERLSIEAETSAIIGCAADAGFVVTATADGLFSTDPAVAGTSEALQRCAEGLRDPKDNRQISELSLEEVSTLYDRALDTASCLEAEGYKISAPPSRDAWIQARYNLDPDEWTPFQEAIKLMEERPGGPDAATYYALFEKCPQQGLVAFASFG